jgi:hypothetical protein
MSTATSPISTVAVAGEGDAGLDSSALGRGDKCAENCQSQYDEDSRSAANDVTTGLAFRSHVFYFLMSFKLVRLGINEI